MADPTTIPESIEQNAIAGVDSVTVDGVSVRAMDVDKQITAHRFASGQAAATTPTFGLRVSQSKPQCSQ